MDLKNRWVNFKIRDVFIPDPQKLLIELYGDDLLQGRVVDLSDSGREEDVFAVVEVEGVGQPVVVPVASIVSVL